MYYEGVLALQNYARVTNFIDINDPKYRWILLAIACAFMVQDSEGLVPAAWEEWKIAPFTRQVCTMCPVPRHLNSLFFICDYFSMVKASWNTMTDCLPR